MLVGSFPTSLLGEAPIPPNLVRVVVHSGVDRPQDDQTRNAMRVGGAGYFDLSLTTLPPLLADS